MFEPLDDRLASSVRRWQAPRLGADAGTGFSPVASSSQGERESATDTAFATGGDAGTACAGPAAEALQRRFEEGRARGFADAQAAAHGASLGKAVALISALTREQDRHDTRLEDELLALARAMARLILRRELEHDVGMMRGIVREALAQLPVSAATPSVRLHPDDAAAVAELMAPEEAERLVADPALARGDCLVEAGASIIDAGIDAWVARIASENGLLEPLDAGAAEHAAT